MYFKNELDFMPGIYKCSGDVKNLRFKIRLEIIKSSMIPLSSSDEPDCSLDPQYFEREELEFGWNEKMFSTHEKDFYICERNLKSALDQEYHEKVKKLEDQKTTSFHRLFTYTSRDEVPSTLLKDVCKNEDMTDFSLSKEETIIMRNNLQTISATAHAANEIQDPIMTLPVKNIIDFHPSEAVKRHNRTLTRGYEIMYVAADLCDKEISEDNEECNNHILFKITWNKRTFTLTVMPDLASFASPGYKIDIDKLSDTRYVYRYWLLNISPTDESNVGPNNGKLCEQVISHQSSPFNLDFELPIRNTRNFFVFIEIQKAFGFECENLFIRYYVDLQRPWTTDKSQLLHGITQQCRPKKNSGVIFFNHLFELKLLEDCKTVSIQNDAGSSNYPQVLLEICSLDSWKRFRVEGYAWIYLPLDKGHHKIILNSWRPASCSHRDQLKRFFIGMDNELADVTYAGGISSDINPVLGRYGFTTISSGNVQIAIDVVQQNCASMMPPRTKNRRSLSFVKTNKLMSNVNNILEAFKKAREKMLSVRDPITTRNDLSEPEI